MDVKTFEVFPKSQKAVLEKRVLELEDILDSLHNDNHRDPERKDNIKSVIRELDLVRFKLSMEVS